MWRRWVRRGHRVFDQLGAAARAGDRRDQRPCARRRTRARRDRRHPRRRGACAASACPRARSASCPGWSGTQRLVRRDRRGPRQVPGADRRAGRARRRRCASAWSTRSCRRGKGHGGGAGARRRRSPARAGLGAARQAADRRCRRARRLRPRAGRAGRRAWPRTTQDAREGVASFREKRAAQLPRADEQDRTLRRARCRDCIGLTGERACGRESAGRHNGADSPTAVRQQGGESNA